MADPLSHNGGASRGHIQARSHLARHLWSPVMPIDEHQVRYSSFLARLLLAPIFRDQWVIPQAPPYLERLFTWYERYRMNIDVSSIRIDRPIFFLSMPRCGSSMLQNILSAHPQAAYITNMMHQFRTSFCAAEYFRRRFALDVEGERFLGDSVSVSGGSPADPVGTWADWVHYDPYSLEYTELRASDLSEETRDRIDGDIRKILWCFDPTGDRRFLCKTPALLPQMRLLNDLFPDAKFLHLVRDARPSANSLVKLYKRTNEQLQAIRNRDKRLAEDHRPFIPYPRLPRLQEYVDRYGPDDIRTTANLWKDGVNYFEQRKGELATYLEVRYEDILLDPPDQIQKILDFCELPAVPRSQAAFWDQLGNVGSIHHKNVYGNFADIEAICGPEMRRYGYL
jgi:hypothetical protein